MTHFTKKTLDFLKEIAANNNREWFAEHKPEWNSVREEAKAFLSELEKEMNTHDMIESTKLFRINRDIRFSKDKTPYNTHISMSMKRAGSFRRGGYYLRIQPGQNFMAAGFWGPEPADLKLIRAHLERDASPMRKIISSKSFRLHFGALEGDQLKSAPRGFDKNHPNIDLLRMKQFIVTKKFSNKAICSEGFLEELSASYTAVRPFFDYMSDILTHDLDGVPLYEG